MKNKKHLHKYRRVKLGKNKTVIYKCTIPSCTHYISKDLMKGRMASCARCEKPFIFGKIQRFDGNVRCDECRDIREKEDVKDIEKFLEEQGLS